MTVCLMDGGGDASDCGARWTFGESGSGIISGTISEMSSRSHVSLVMRETGETGDTGDHSVSSLGFGDGSTGCADLVSSSLSTDTGDIFLFAFVGRSGERFREALNAPSYGEV